MRTGKTILSSLIIESLLVESRKLNSSPVVFFYCKHADAQRNTFMAVAKAMIAQLLKQNDGLVSYLHDHFLASRQPELVSTQLCKEILEIALRSVPQVLIVIDGIDECEMGERRVTLQFFTSLIEDDSGSRNLRGLFVSQDENDIKDLSRDADALRITESHNRGDIVHYVARWCRKLTLMFNLSEAEKDAIASTVCLRAEGSGSAKHLFNMSEL